MSPQALHTGPAVRADRCGVAATMVAARPAHRDAGFAYLAEGDLLRGRSSELKLG